MPSTPENQRRYDKTSYERRLAAGRCTRCAEKIKPGYPYKTCEACRDGMKEYAAVWRKDKAPDETWPSGKAKGHTGRSSALWRNLDASEGRCRCGLLLPCNSCLPSIEAIAGSRRGPGATFPEGGP